MKLQRLSDGVYEAQNGLVRIFKNDWEWVALDMLPVKLETGEARRLTESTMLATLKDSVEKLTSIEIDGIPHHRREIFTEQDGTNWFIYSASIKRAYGSDRQWVALRDDKISDFVRRESRKSLLRAIA